MSKKVIYAVVLALLFLGILGFAIFRSLGSAEVIAEERKRVKKAKSPSKTKTSETSKSIVYEQDRVSLAERDDNPEKNDHKSRSESPNNAKLEKYRTREISYSDPVNDRVLGDPRWAATNSKEELERVEKAFEIPAINPDIIRLSRQRSIDVIKPIVRKCYEELLIEKPDAKGRFVVEWMAEKTGKISEVRMGLNPFLDIPSFTECIINRSQNLTFETNAEDIFVEYPFAFL